MFGSSPLASVLGAIDPNTRRDEATCLAFARAAADLGLPLLFVEPGGKRPLDLRSNPEKSRDRKAGGNTGGVHLASCERRTLEKYIRRAFATERKRGHPSPLSPGQSLNFGVRLAGSGFVVADADTPAEVACLTAFLEQHYGVGKAPGATVLTPGSVNQAHSGGAQWWFSLPDGFEMDPTIVPSVSKITMPGHEAGFSLYSGNAYVLVPPSTRHEGPYEFVGLDTPATPQMLDFLGDALVRGRVREQQRHDRLDRLAAGDGSTLDEQVAKWSEVTPWVDILTPAGWLDAGTVDACGCEVWTAPGTHASRKSATAHTAQCTQSHVDITNPPLHVWTDNPGSELEAHIAQRGTKTISKLTVFALLQHGGDMAIAMDAAGISVPLAGFGVEPSPQNQAAGVDARAASLTSGVDTRSMMGSATPDAPASAMATVHTLDAVGVDEEGTWIPPRPPIDIHEVVTTPGGRDMWDAWGVDAPPDEVTAAIRRQKMPPFGSLRQYADRPKPQFVIEGMLEHGGLTSIVGESGVGKSAVALDMAAHVCAGRAWHGREVIQTNVLYVAGEGVTGAVSRLHAWEEAHDCYDLEDTLFIVEEAVLFGSGADNWAYLARMIRKHNIGFVVFDTLARMSSGLDENSATDMGTAVTIFDRLRRTTGAGVCFVHHTGKAGTSARGSSALKGALDSEVLVTKTMVDWSEFDTVDGVAVDVDGNPLPGKPLCVQVTKQKNGEDGIHEYLCMVQACDSVIITDMAGKVSKPLFGEGLVDVGRAQPESVEDVTPRVVAFVGQFTSGEANPTIADIVRGVRPRRPETTTSHAWGTTIRLAVDAALTAGQLHKRRSGFSRWADFE